MSNDNEINGDDAMKNLDNLMDKLLKVPEEDVEESEEPTIEEEPEADE